MTETRRRSDFGPTLLLGLASTALMTVAAAKPWFAADSTARSMVPGEDPTRADVPLALALALVALAGWGAVLVTRGAARRLVAVVALVAAVGVAGCLVISPFRVPDQVRAAVAEASLGAQGAGADSHLSVHVTGWFVAAAVAVVLAVAALLNAVRRAPAWPSMSTRYDAPTGRASAPAADEPELPDDASSIDLWKAIDEGRDPTTRPPSADL